VIATAPLLSLVPLVLIIWEVVGFHVEVQLTSPVVLKTVLLFIVLAEAEYFLHMLLQFLQHRILHITAPLGPAGLAEVSFRRGLLTFPHDYGNFC